MTDLDRFKCVLQFETPGCRPVLWDSAPGVPHPGICGSAVGGRRAGRAGRQGP